MLVRLFSGIESRMDLSYLQQKGTYFVWLQLLVILCYSEIMKWFDLLLPLLLLLYFLSILKYHF